MPANEKAKPKSKKKTLEKKKLEKRAEKKIEPLDREGLEALRQKLQKNFH
jgi:hypothetical protein